MRRRTFAALGAGATASAAACALLTTGVVGTSLAILVAPPLAPPAVAEELQPFDGCEQLRQWYVDAALPLVGPWGLGWSGYRDRLDLAATRAVAQDAAAPEPAVGSRETGTNVQETGVDEPDVAKTNGTFVVHLAGRELVLTDVSGDEPRELSRTSLPRRLADPDLLLVGDTVVVFGDAGYHVDLDRRVMSDSVLPSPLGGTDTTTHVITVDVSEPMAPRVQRHDRIEGHLVSAREYDGTVRAVVSTGAPRLDFVQPTRTRTAREARRENRQVVRDTTIEDWLPSASSGDRSAPLVDCTDVRHPEQQSGFGTISVVTFDAEDPAERSTTAVTAGGELVYSSADRLYLATARGGWAEPVPLGAGGEGRKPAPPRTQVHAFAIDGPVTEYLASGEVPGMVRDRWSFSEYDGHLRVATALGRRSWDPRENAVVVLAERGTDLVEVGRVDGMGIDEQIQSVRWFGDLAVLVTFRQVDPLYTVDLSDPTAPRVMGELKIPGFSSYLHPVGDGRLLGIGQDATNRGVTRGAQAALFDLTDLDRPRRTDTVGLGRGTGAAVQWDSRAFTYLPEVGTALTPVQNHRNGETRLAIVRVNPDGTLTRTMTGRVAGWDSGSVRTLPLGDGEVALVVRDRVSLVPVG
jgi:hypothetical protein